MTCRLYEEELSSYLDGELPALRAAKVEAHLKTCPHCQAELAAMGGIALRLRAASQLIEVSHDFDRRVLRAVGYFRITGWQRPVKSYLRPLLIVMATLLAMLAAVWHFCTRPIEPPVWQPQPAVSAVTPPAAPLPGRPDQGNNRHQAR